MSPRGWIGDYLVLGCWGSIVESHLSSHRATQALNCLPVPVSFVPLVTSHER